MRKVRRRRRVIRRAFFTVPEIEAMLRLSRSQVYALIESGRLKRHRYGTRRNPRGGEV
jgi:excisionase family DNA binding protein